MDDQPKNDQPQPQPPPAQPSPSSLIPQMTTEEGTMKMRNVMNGEIVDAIKAGGKDAYGRVRYTPKPGFEPVGNHTVDVDGTWLEVVTPKGAPRGAQMPAQSGAPAVLSDEAQAQLQDETTKVAASRAAAATGQPPSDTVVTPDGTVVHGGEGGEGDGATADLGSSLQTGKKRR